jgi:CPA2 family monovalent cation:H+ antiporter-2
MEGAAHDLGSYSDFMVVLGAAAILVPALARLRISPVLGFLIAGAVLGPAGLGAFAHSMPWLDWFTVTKEDTLEPLAELGIVFLLFLVGLELSLKRLMTMRRLVFGLGGSQVIITAAVIAIGLLLFGQGSSEAVIIGMSLALSSTAVVVEVLSRQQRLAGSAGRSAFAVLLFQDLAVVPLLLLVGILTPGQEGSIVANAALAFGQAAFAVALIVGVGTVALRPMFRLVATSENSELFVAATLLVAVGSGLVAAGLGMSMALGAFIAGLLLAETEFRRAIEATIEPFRGLLLGVFFFTVGMSLDFGVLLASPLALGGAIVALLAVKMGIVAALMRAYGFSWPVTVETAALLGPCGEFAFIIASIASFNNVLTGEMANFLQAITAFSMALIPLLDFAARNLSRRIAGLEQGEKLMPPVLSELPPEDAHPRALVIGFGRVGELVSDMLSRHGIPHIVTERDPKVVREARAAGRPVYFGDGRNTQFLTSCGLLEAKAVIITIHTWAEVGELVLACRSLNPRIVTVARARDAEHAKKLYEIGVTDAVPETIEASLQLSEAALVGLGVPTGPVIASIHEKRDEFRATLQAAIRDKSRTVRGVKAKTTSLRAATPAAAETLVPKAAPVAAREVAANDALAKEVATKEEA